MSHLLAKRFDCCLDKGLLCVNEQLAVLFCRVLTHESTSLSKALERPEVCFFHACKYGGNLLLQGRHFTIHVKDVTVFVPGDICQFTFVVV